MRNAFTLFAALMGAVFLFPGHAAAQQKKEPGVFDYYLLSLSWSPAFCARQDYAKGSVQCDADKGFGWIVHGLWPQSVDGDNPRACASGRPGPKERVPRAVMNETFGVMPDNDLILHEWRTHGACSGLSPTDYFATVRAAAAKVKTPSALSAPTRGLSVSAAQVEARFVEANPGLRPDMIAVICQRHRVSEVRVCLNKDLTPRPCGKGVRDRCEKADALE